MMHSSVVSSQIQLALLIGHHKASFAFVRLGYIYRNVGCETVSVELIDLGITDSTKINRPGHNIRMY